MPPDLEWPSSAACKSPRIASEDPPVSPDTLIGHQKRGRSSQRSFVLYRTGARGWGSFTGTCWRPCAAGTVAAQEGLRSLRELVSDSTPGTDHPSPQTVLGQPVLCCEANAVATYRCGSPAGQDLQDTYLCHHDIVGYACKRLSGRDLSKCILSCQPALIRTTGCHARTIVLPSLGMEDDIFPDVFDFAYGESCDVAFFSLLTTLHRGTFATSESSGNITQPCYDAARKSLRAHLAVIEQVRVYRDGSLTQVYLTWALQDGAFTPLIVVFLHAISTFNEDDLSLLQQFQGSLSHVQATENTDGIGRLQSTCAISISVAKAYVGSRPAVSTGDADVVRRENVHQAFGRSHAAGDFGNPQQNFGLGRL